MKELIEPPIFIYENGDLEIYESIRDAEVDLESIDVRNNIYLGYDSRGRRLRIFAESSNAVVIMEAEQEPTHGDELRAHLVEFLEFMGTPSDAIKAASLQNLVEMVWKFRFKFTPMPWENVVSAIKRWFKFRV